MTTIILPVYNRPDHTNQTIESLYANTNDFQLTVLDDCSDDATRNLLKKLQASFGFHLIRSDVNRGPGASRNSAIASVKNKTELIYFSDNDVYFKPNWLPILTELYYDSDVALLGASCHPYLQDKETLHIREYEIGIKDAVSGYSQLTLWKMYDRFGPFETQEGLDKKTGRSDDWMFCQKMVQAGLKVGSVRPELVIPTGLTDSYGQPAIGQETFTNQEGVYVA